MNMIPAICENPNCVTVFFSDRAFSVPPAGESCVLHDCRFGPCPNCGGLGRVPDGVYMGVEGIVKIFPTTDQSREMLRKIFGIAQMAVSRQVSTDDARIMAEAEAPELNALWKLLPKNQDQAYQFWLLIIAAFGALLMAYQTFRTPELPQILVPKVVIEPILNDHRGSHDDTHKGPLE